MAAQFTKKIYNSKISLSLDKYLKEIGKIKLLSVEEEFELAKKIKKDDDQEALEKLTQSNLRFVVSIAKQYQNQGLSLEDLIHEGNLGLIKAAKRFDETRELKFISYAVWWVRQSIKQAISEQSRIVRLPLNQVSAINKITKIYSQLEQNLERDPTEQELAENLDLSEGEINNVLKVSHKHTSIEASIVEGEESSLLDVLVNTSEKSPEEQLIEDSLAQEIKKACNVLSKKEIEVLMLFYGLNDSLEMSLEEIAEKLSIKKEKARNLKEKALKKLRQESFKKKLRYYLM